jgi:hypothetical protein
MATSEAPERAGRGCYVYGILPGEVEVADEVRGIGGHPIDLVRYGDLAALVSEVDLEATIGSPEDLATHERLLDAVATEVPVLPLRFGAVMTTPEAVEQELLAGNHDRFLATVSRLEGRVQFVVKGRYDRQTVLREVLAENDEADALRERIRGGTEKSTYDARVRLGELVYQAISAKREADTQEAAAMLEPHAVASAAREPTHQDDAVYIAFLVDLTRREDFAEAAHELGGRWRGRVEVRLLGPMAPYDFVVTPVPEG